MLTLAVALAAGAGAACRYVVDLLVTRRWGGGFPWGTLLVNLSGSLLLGLVAGGAGPGVGAVVGAGFCGGFTTLSTWAWESLALGLRSWAGWAYVLGSLGGALLAAAAGLGLAGVLGS